MACVLAVLVLALLPSPPPVFTTGWDKSNHLLAFGALAWPGWGVAWIAGQARNDNFEGPQ